MSDLGPNPCRYLICCTPRTGSTLLSAGLRFTGEAGAPAEPFDPRILAESERPEMPPEELIRVVLDETASPNGVSGSKMMWHHVAALIAPSHPDSISTAELAAFARRLPPMRFIWITRRDRVAQAVSFARALRTDCWTAGAPGADTEPPFIWDEVDQLKKLLCRHDRMWGEYFAVAGVSPLKILYEDFAANYASTMRRVFDYLGLESVPVPEPVIKRQADAISQEWIRRYYEPTLGDHGRTLLRRMHRGLGLTWLRDRWRRSRFA